MDSKKKRQTKNGEKYWQKTNFPQAPWQQLLMNETNQQYYGEMGKCYSLCYAMLSHFSHVRLCVTP